MDSLVELAQAHGVPLKVLGAAREVNQYLADRLVEKISLRAEFSREQGSRNSGLAFKPNTNSVAGSSSMRLAETLVSKGAHVRAYDPVAIPEAKTRLNGSVRYCDPPSRRRRSDALVVGTDGQNSAGWISTGSSTY